MKKPEAAWERGRFFEPGHPEDDQGPPFEEEGDHEEESPEFTAIRRIELLVRLHHMAFRAAMRDEGLPPAQAGAIRVIIRHPGMSQRELADRLHIQRATATVMLQKMERAGRIQRRPDPEDQRISRIYPTALALKNDQENRNKVSAYFSRCWQDIDPASLDITLATLRHLEENLRGILGEHPDPSIEE